MPTAVAPNHRAGSAARDDIDDLLNYDDAVEDFLKDIPLGKENTQDNNNTSQEPTKDIDEEITIKKKRKPNPKLDENRLLSDVGIPRLRKITKTRLKFRGKGHEFSDISRLLNTYQLWLDDLFPRAKFKDALIDVEKVGHMKRMQVTRRAWLDATKPRQRDASPEKDADFVMSGALPDTGTGENGTNTADKEDGAIFGDSSPQHEGQNDFSTSSGANDAPDDDELDALLAENSNATSVAKTAPVQRKKGPFEDDDSDEADLDALLAAEPSLSNGKAGAGGAQKSSEPNDNQLPFEDDFGDDEEAMAGMDML
jgi:replication fork protection complex subunit Csm3/Swi3